MASSLSLSLADVWLDGLDLEGSMRPSSMMMMEGPAIGEELGQRRASTAGTAAPTPVPPRPSPPPPPQQQQPNDAAPTMPRRSASPSPPPPPDQAESPAAAVNVNLEAELLAEARAMAQNPQRWRMGPKLLDVHERQARAGVGEYYTAEHLARLWTHSACRRRRRRQQQQGGADNDANDSAPFEDLYPSAGCTKVLCKSVHPQDCRACVTCHFCRQKTVDAKTRCTCELGGARNQPGGLMRGAWCASCLALRMGERLEDALADPDWRCPCCRDLCNCSGAGCLRARRGLEPTNQLSSEARGLGYPSVAHYLVLTHLCSRPELMAPVMADCGRRRAVTAVAGPDTGLGIGLGNEDAAAMAAMAAAAAAAETPSDDAAAANLLRSYDLDALVQGRLRAVRLAIVRQVDAQVSAMRLELPLLPVASSGAAGQGTAAAPSQPSRPAPPIAGRGFCTGILDLDDGADGGGGGEDDYDDDEGGDAEGEEDLELGGGGGAGTTLRALLSSARRRGRQTTSARAARERERQQQQQRQQAAAAAAPEAPFWPPPGTVLPPPPSSTNNAADSDRRRQNQRQPEPRRGPATTTSPASDGAWWVRSALWRAGATPAPASTEAPVRQQQQQQQQQQPRSRAPSPAPAAAVVVEAPQPQPAAATTVAAPVPPPQLFANAPPPACSRFQSLAAYAQGLIEAAERAEAQGAQQQPAAIADADADADAALDALLSSSSSSAPPPPPPAPPGAASYARLQIDDLVQREFASGWLEDVAVSEFAVAAARGNGGGGGAVGVDATTTAAGEQAAPAEQQQPSQTAPPAPPPITLTHDDLRSAVDLLLLVATRGPPRAAAEATERLARRGPFVDVARSDARARAAVLRGAFDLLTHFAATPSASSPLASMVPALAASALDVIFAVATEARALRRLLATPRDHTGPLRLGPVDLPADRRPGSAAARLAQLSALLRADEELLALALARLQAAAEALGRGARAFLLAPAPGMGALAAVLDDGSCGSSGLAPAPFGRALRSAALAAAYTVVASAAPDIGDDRAWAAAGGSGGSTALTLAARLAELRELERATRRTLLAPVERLVEAAYPGRRGRAAAVEAALQGPAERGGGGGAATAAGSLAAPAATTEQQQPVLSLRQQQQQQQDAQAVGSIAVEVLARLYALQAQALCGAEAAAATAAATTGTTTTTYTPSPALSWTACVETPLHAPFTSPDLFWTHCSSLRARHLAVFGAAHALAAAPSALARDAGVRAVLRLWLRGLVDYGRRFSVAYLTLVLAAHPRTGLALFAPAAGEEVAVGGGRAGRSAALALTAAAGAAATTTNDGGHDQADTNAQAAAAAAWSDVVRDGAAGDLRAALVRRVLKAQLAHGAGAGAGSSSSEAAERLAAPHPLEQQQQQQPQPLLDGPSSVLFVCSKLVDVLNARKAELLRAQVGDDDPRRLLRWQRAACAVALAAADALAESAASAAAGPRRGSINNNTSRAAAAATVPLLLEWVALAFRTALAAVCSARAQMVASGRDAASAAAEAAEILPASAIVHYLPALSAIGRLEERHGYRLAEEARPVATGVGGAGATARPAAGPCLRRALLGAVSAVLDEPSALDDPPHAEDQAAVLHVARALARAGSMDAAPALAHHALGVHVRLALEEAAAAYSPASSAASAGALVGGGQGVPSSSSSALAAAAAAAAGGMPAWTWRRAVNALRLLDCLFRERGARQPATLALLAPCVLRPLVALLSLPPPLPPPPTTSTGGADDPAGALALEAHALRLERYSLLQRRAMGAVAALLLGGGGGGGAAEGAAAATTSDGAAAAAAADGGAEATAAAAPATTGPSGVALPPVQPPTASLGGGSSGGGGALATSGGGIDGPLRRREPLTPAQLDAAKRALLHVAVRWCLTAVDCATTTAADVTFAGPAAGASAAAASSACSSSDRLLRLQRVALAIAPPHHHGGPSPSPSASPRAAAAAPPPLPHPQTGTSSSSLAETDAAWWPLRCGGAASAEHALFTITGRAEAVPQSVSEWAASAPASASAAAQAAVAAAAQAAAAQPNARKRAMLARRSLSRAALAFLRRLADEGGGAGAAWAAPAVPFLRAALDALLRPRPGGGSGSGANSNSSSSSPLREAYRALHAALVARGALPAPPMTPPASDAAAAATASGRPSSAVLLALPGEGAPLLQVLVLGSGGGGLGGAGAGAMALMPPPPPRRGPPAAAAAAPAPPPRPAVSAMASMAGGGAAGGAAALAATPLGPRIRGVQAAHGEEAEEDGEVSWQPEERLGRGAQGATAGPQQQHQAPPTAASRAFASVAEALTRARRHQRLVSASQQQTQTQPLTQPQSQQPLPTPGVGASVAKPTARPPAAAITAAAPPTSLRGCVLSALPRLTKDFGKPVLILLLADAPSAASAAPSDQQGAAAASGAAAPALPPPSPAVAKVLVADPAVLENLRRQMAGGGGAVPQQPQHNPSVPTAVAAVPVPPLGATVTLSRAQWTAAAFLVKGNSGCAVTYAPPTPGSAAFARAAAAASASAGGGGGGRERPAPGGARPQAAAAAAMAPLPPRRALPVQQEAATTATLRQQQQQHQQDGGDDQSQPTDQQPADAGPSAAGALLPSTPADALLTIKTLDGLDDSQATVAR